jgi:hypothetical protein
LIKRSVFWLGNEAPVEIAHRYDCEYVNYPREKMLQLAGQLAKEGLIELSGGSARATSALQKEEASMIAAMHRGVEAGKAATKISA